MGFLENKRRARLFYKYLSRVYDRINPFVWTESMRTEALEMLALDPEDRVLDVGCGTGFGTTGLLERTRDVHGLDQSVHQLEHAWAKLGKHEPVRFVLGDAERLPYRASTFDAVWSSGSIEYWPNPIATLRECRRVVVPGGTVLVVGPAAPANPLIRRLADAIMLFYDRAEADHLFESAGFADWDHRILQARTGSPPAIVTVARTPD